jgi:hypothetical protein
MATDKDHIDALRARLFNKIREKEAEIAEIQAVYDSLGAAPKILEGKFNLEPKEQVELVKHRTLANRNVTELVRKYVEDFNRDSVITIPELVKWLLTHGVTGKERSLYSAVHVILKKETSKNPDLHYTKGVGFYKGSVPAETYRLPAPS